MKINDLSLLEVFVQVSAHKSFSKAASEMNVSLPSISRKIQMLEAQIGTRLVYRTTRSVSLATDGELFLSSTQDILRDLGALASTFSQAKDLSGEIRVACLPSIVMRWLPEVLITFQRLHSKINFSVESSDCIVGLTSERIDVAIRVQKPQGSDLVFRKIAINILVLVASPRYLKEFGTPTSF